MNATRPGPTTLRTFAAVFPPDDVLDALDRLKQHLQPQLPGLRWTARHNLHFTLRFFGDLTQEEVDRAGAVVRQVCAAAAPFDLELAGCGVFSNWKSPRVFWVGAQRGSATLEALARTLERGFRDARLGKADKPFQAHLTLGRWREPHGLDPDALKQACAAVGPIAAFSVNRVGVIKSTLDPRGSIYEVMHESRLDMMGPTS
jgi:2'-5' RNA ligase